METSAAGSTGTARGRLWLLPLVVGVAWCLVFASWADDTARLVLYAGFGSAAILFILAGIRAHRPRRLGPWLAVVAGLGLLSAGDIGWFLYGINGSEAPFPSLLDIAYLAGYVVVAVGIGWLFRSRVPGGDRAGLIDAVILACGVGILAWVFLMAPYVADETLDTAGAIVAIAYPLMDVLLLGVVARVLLTPASRGPSFWFLVGFLGLFAVTDFIYGFQVLEGTYATGLLDLGWIAGVFCLAIAGTHPSMAALGGPVAPGEPKLGVMRLAMLGVACLLAPATFVIQELRGQPADLGVVIGGWVVLFVLVLVRLALTVDSLRTTLRQRRQLEDELEYRALHDGLTGLPNRHVFGERLQAALRATSGAVGVLFIDLDDFKGVNDSLGHEAGDELLVAVAARISGAVRPTDLAARFGGDEFAILLEDVPDEAAAQAAADRVLDALRRPVRLKGTDYVSWASIGIAVGAGSETDASELMRDADIAMYLAKGQGKHRTELFRPALHADVVRRLGLKAELQNAVDERQFVLHYQPIVRLDDGEIVGVEALVRWQHPERGLVPPAEFIPSAETTGLIVPLGRWILDEAVRQAAEWARAVGRPIAVSVNLSARQLEDPGFAADLERALAAHDLSPRFLVTEVTESRDLDQDSIAAALDAIRALGVRVAIDDFGTGYSSFGCLGRLGVDFLKIDRRFVQAIDTDARDAKLGEAIVQLGASLELQTVAEGIETAAQLARLRDLGVPYGQGYLFDRPMPASLFGERIGWAGAAVVSASATPASPAPVGLGLRPEALRG